MSETNQESQFANSQMPADVQHGVVDRGNSFFGMFARRAAGLVLAGIATLSVIEACHVLTSNDPIKDGNPNAAAAPNHCPPTTVDLKKQPSVDIAAARDSVTTMKFGITSNAYIDATRGVSDDIVGAKNTQVIEQTLDKINDKFVIRFNTLPSNSDLTVGVMPLEESQKHADEYLQLLSKTPKSLLEKMPKTHLYLVSDMKGKDGKEGSAAWGSMENGEHYLILNAAHSTSDPTHYDSIEHDLAAHFTRLFEIGLCGKDAAKDDEFAAINMENTKGYAPQYIEGSVAYTTDEAKLKNYIDHNRFASVWGRTGVIGDVASVGGGLLENGYQTSGYSGGFDDRVAPIDKKKELLIARQATVEPNIRNYYAYLGYLDGRPFPHHIVNDGQDFEDVLRAECLASIPAPAASTPSVDIPIKNWVTMQPDTLSLFPVHQSWDQEAWGGRGARKITYAYAWEGVTEKDTDNDLTRDYERQVRSELIKLPNQSLAYESGVRPLITVNGKEPQPDHCKKVSIHISNNHY